MGLDLCVHKIKGRRDDGSLITESFNCENWNSDRLVVRKTFINHPDIDFESISTEMYGDDTHGFRPSNFNQVDKFIDTLEGIEKEYIQNIRDILYNNPEVYLYCT